MFCGLPVMVPVEPTLAAVARPIRWGIGSNFIRRARCKTSGVSATQTTSLMRNAESRPERTIVTASRPLRRGDAAQSHTDNPLEEARQPQHTDDDHHPEQQEQRLEVDGLGADRLLETQNSRDQHEGCADESDAGPVHAQPRHLTQRQPGIGHREDNPCQPYGPVVHDLFPSSQLSTERRLRDHGMNRWNGGITASWVSHELDLLAGCLPQRIGHAHFQRVLALGQLSTFEWMGEETEG